MLKPAVLPPGERLEFIAIGPGGEALYHVALDAQQREIRTRLGVLLDGEKSSSLTTSMIFETLASGDKVTAACHKAFGHYPMNEDAIAINIHGSAVTGIDGYGPDGTSIASAFGEAMLFDDLDAAVGTTTASIRPHSKSGACFAHERITMDAASGTKVLEHAQAGDVHVIVLDAQGNLVWESADEDIASNLMRNGFLTPDEALYNQYKAVVTNSISNVCSITRSPSLPLLPGYRVIVASDGLFDNLTTDEFLGGIAGRDAPGIVAQTEALVIPRMQNAKAIRAATPDREAAGRYSDGYRSLPKRDNLSIAVIDIC